MLLLLPLVTRRHDPLQGVLARQVPRIVAEQLREAGVEAAYLPLVAERAAQRALVLLREPLPQEVRNTWMREEGANACVSGTAGLRGGIFTLTLTWHDASGRSSPVRTFSGSRVGIPGIVAEAAQALAERVGLPANETTRPQGSWHLTDAEALIALCVDLDNETLLAAVEDDPQALTEEDDAWRWAHRALELAPESSLARARLEARIAGLLEAGATQPALRATLALARSLPHDAEAVTRAARLAVRGVASPAEALQALRSLGAPEHMPAEVQLLLGEHLVRAGHHGAAAELLGTLLEHPKVGEVASAWLGVAEASLGDVEKAVARWQGLQHSSGDPRVQRMAQENLERATPLASPPTEEKDNA